MPQAMYFLLEIWIGLCFYSIMSRRWGFESEDFIQAIKIIRVTTVQKPDVYIHGHDTPTLQTDGQNTCCNTAQQRIQILF